jgi:hypothetical protein
MVLMRGYPGPVNVPFAQIPSTVPGANPNNPNKSITVPTWPMVQGRGHTDVQISTAASLEALEEVEQPPTMSLAQTWLQMRQNEAEGNSKHRAPALTTSGSRGQRRSKSSAQGACSILEGYFEYTWPGSRHHSLRASHPVNSTDECCALCGDTVGCESFCFYKGNHSDDGPAAAVTATAAAADSEATVCYLYSIAMPAQVPGPANPHYDAGNVRGPAPSIAPGPGPSPGPPPGPPRPPPPPPPPIAPYEGHAFPKTTTEAVAVSTALLHEALAPYLIVANSNTWFSYAWFYGVQSGWAPCPSNPGACLAPPEWYPDLRRPIGKPLGPATKVGTVYKREFERCTAVIDLSDRRKSSVTWK